MWFWRCRRRDQEAIEGFEGLHNVDICLRLVVFYRNISGTQIISMIHSKIFGLLSFFLDEMTRATPCCL